MAARIYPVDYYYTTVDDRPGQGCPQRVAGVDIGEGAGGELEAERLVFGRALVSQRADDHGCGVEHRAS